MTQITAGNGGLNNRLLACSLSWTSANELSFRQMCIVYGKRNIFQIYLVKPHDIINRCRHASSKAPLIK